MPPPAQAFFEFFVRADHYVNQKARKKDPPAARQGDHTLSNNSERLDVGDESLNGFFRNELLAANQIHDVTNGLLVEELQGVLGQARNGLHHDFLAIHVLDERLNTQRFVIHNMFSFQF